jgi:hypothetical protein
VKSSKSDGQVKDLGEVIRVNEGRIQPHLKGVARDTVGETLNQLLQAEPDTLCRTRQ